MSIIIPANSAASGGYEVDNSARFQTASLKRSAGSKTNATKATISMWFKRSELVDCVLMQSYTDDSNRAYIKLLGDTFYFFDRSGGTTENYWVSTFVLRDVSAFYHLHINIDTGNGTVANRFIVHLNGVNQPVANFTNNATYGSGVTSNWQQASGTNQFTIGANESVNDQYFGGYMSEVVYLDGQVVAYDSFGEFDEDSGIWKPIDVSGLTPGNTGFYLDFEDSSDLGADVIGSNDFTATGLAAIDQTTDTPTNNFATWNPNLAMNSTMVIADGNLTGTTGSNYASGASNCWFSTIGVSSGKWYGEFKESAGTNDQGQQIGVGYDLSKFQQGGTASAYNVGYIAEGWGYLGSEGTVVNNNSTVLSGLSTWTVGDTIGIALDMDNHKLYFRKNGGSWENSGNPESGSTGTGAISLTTGETYFFGCSDASLSNTYTFQANFGSPPFAITSGNTDGDGFGNFEYAVPSGYFSLCTKNLAEYG